MMLHKITMARNQSVPASMAVACHSQYTQARITLNTDGMPDDNLENKVRLAGWGGVRWPRV